MPEPASFFTLPAEIRWQIYSHLYLEEVNVDFVLSHRRHPNRPLMYTCRQLYHEILGYFYSQNSFSIQLLDWEDTDADRWGMARTINSACLELNHFDMVERLQIEVDSSCWMDSYFPKSAAARLQAYRGHVRDCVDELEKLLGLIREVETKKGALSLKKLKVMDHLPFCLTDTTPYYQYQKGSEEIPSEAYKPTLQKLEDGIREVSVKVVMQPPGTHSSNY